MPIRQRNFFVFIIKDSNLLIILRTTQFISIYCKSSVHPRMMSRNKMWQKSFKAKIKYVRNELDQILYVISSNSICNISWEWKNYFLHTRASTDWRNLSLSLSLSSISIHAHATMSIDCEERCKPEEGKDLHCLVEE